MSPALPPERVQLAEAIRRAGARDAQITALREAHQRASDQVFALFGEQEAAEVALALAREGQRAAAIYSLIVTAKMNHVDPQAWLADVLSRIAVHPMHRLNELLPWNWRDARTGLAAAA